IATHHHLEQLPVQILKTPLIEIAKVLLLAALYPHAGKDALFLDGGHRGGKLALLHGPRPDLLELAQQAFHRHGKLLCRPVRGTNGAVTSLHDAQASFPQDPRTLRDDLPDAPVNLGASPKQVRITWI